MRYILYRDDILPLPLILENLEIEWNDEIENMEMIQENGHYDRIRASTRRNRHARVTRITNRATQMQEEFYRQLERNRNDQGLTTTDIEKYSCKNRYRHFVNENGDVKCTICLEKFQAKLQ